MWPIARLETREFAPDVFVIYAWSEKTNRRPLVTFPKGEKPSILASSFRQCRTGLGKPIDSHDRPGLLKSPAVATDSGILVIVIPSSVWRSFCRAHM